MFTKGTIVSWSFIFSLTIQVCIGELEMLLNWLILA